MYDTYAAYACIVDALYGANPKFEVGIERIFYQYRCVAPGQSVGNFLHREGVGYGASTYPQNIYVGFQCLFDMLSCGHFGSHKHPGLFLYVIEPSKTFFTYTKRS